MPTRGFGTLSTYFWKSSICRSLYRMMYGISPFQCSMFCFILLTFLTFRRQHFHWLFFFSRFTVWNYEVVGSIGLVCCYHFFVDKSWFEVRVLLCLTRQVLSFVRRTFGLRITMCGCHWFKTPDVPNYGGTRDVGNRSAWKPCYTLWNLLVF